MECSVTSTDTTVAEPVKGPAPFAPRQHKQGVYRHLLLLSCIAVSMTLPKHALAESKDEHEVETPEIETLAIKTPKDARLKGLESLRSAVRLDGGVPLPKNLDAFVKDRAAALQLGKALFWDMQVGSDGIQACATCHFHAGADNRSSNQLNPDMLTFIDNNEGGFKGYFNARTISDIRFDTGPANARLTRKDFPFVKSIQTLTRNANGTVGPAENNSNDIASSMGMFFTRFDGIQLGFPTDLGTPLHDPVWNDGGISVRRVEPRNTPTVINAVFNFTNFWDGRANPRFNGQNPFGDQDQNAAILINQPETGLAFARISLDNASLASQAVGPLSSFFEMSFGDPAHGNSRSLPEIGQKLLGRSPQTGASLVPLGLQKIHPQDSVLGALSKAPFNGLSMSYAALIQRAFAEPYWNSTEVLDAGNGLVFTQMEANFSLFFGLAVGLYEATLVADQSPFDRWMETGRFNVGFGKAELVGLNLFVNQGQCITCHGGPELTNASVRNTKRETQVIRAMAMTQGVSFYDNGFYNTSVTPTTDDIGRGNKDAFGQPLAFARQALFDRFPASPEVAKLPFSILGNNYLPAVDENGGSPTCYDTNANGVCDPGDPLVPTDRGEKIHPEFQRVAVDGAFKTPGLRNVELTGPYFHNGGMATLRQVVQFYNRGGNFCDFNSKDLDPSIKPLGLSARQENQLVAFLVALTDPRVQYRLAPFDHPEIRIPVDGLDNVGMRKIKAVGAQGSTYPLKTFLDLNPHDAIFTPAEICSPNLD